jgi:hypothetical protein
MPGKIHFPYRNQVSLGGASHVLRLGAMVIAQMSLI